MTYLIRLSAAMLLAGVTVWPAIIESNVEVFGGDLAVVGPVPAKPGCDSAEDGARKCHGSQVIPGNSSCDAIVGINTVSGSTWYETGEYKCSSQAEVHNGALTGLPCQGDTWVEIATQDCE